MLYSLLFDGRNSPNVLSWLAIGHFAVTLVQVERMFAMTVCLPSNELQEA